MTTAVAVDWTALNSLAQSVGKNTARQWPGIDAEDCAQEALLALLEAQKKLAEQEATEEIVRAIMTRAATRYASKERYAYTVMSANFLYTPREVRGLLEHAYWDESVRETDVPSGPDTKTQVLAWENVCVALWDMDAAWQKLSALDAFRLRKRFRDGEEYPTPAARKAADRAIDKLTQFLNERVNLADDA